MYEIPEFDRNGFNSMTHNSYVRNRARIEDQQEIEEEEEKEDRILEEERVNKFLFVLYVTNIY